MKNFFSTFKEELVFIPLLILGFFILNYMLSAIFPESAFFDFFSQIETLAFRILSFVAALSIAWFGLRIAFPQMFRYLKDEFYHKFDSYDEDTKRKYSIRFFLVFVICVALISRGVGAEKSEVRTMLNTALHAQLDVRETSPNSGPEVNNYLHSVGINYPAPWCAAFVSYNLQQFNIPNPNSGWSPDYGKSNDIIWTRTKGSKSGITPLTGDVVTFYYPILKRIGHVGFFIEKDKSGYFITIEGNTNGSGSREGDGVYKKKREPSKVYAISRYIKS